MPAGTIAVHPAAPAGEQLYRPAVGVIAEDGAYQLQGFRHGDGVMPGEYVVVIESYEGGPIGSLGTPRKCNGTEHNNAPSAVLISDGAPTLPRCKAGSGA